MVAVDEGRSDAHVEPVVWNPSHPHTREAEFRLVVPPYMGPPPRVERFRELPVLEVVQLLGPDSLAPPQRVVLRTGRLLREDFLQQSAFDDRDAYCPLGTQLAMLRVIRRAHTAMASAVEEGADSEVATSVPSLQDVATMRFWAEEEANASAGALAERIESELEGER